MLLWMFIHVTMYWVDDRQRVLMATIYHVSVVREKLGENMREGKVIRVRVETDILQMTGHMSCQHGRAGAHARKRWDSCYTLDYKVGW